MFYILIYIYIYIYIVVVQVIRPTTVFPKRELDFCKSISYLPEKSVAARRCYCAPPPSLAALPALKTLCFQLLQRLPSRKASFFQ